jgi:penicillin-binding protein 1A
LYFNKPLDKLTLAECALLSGIPNRPSLYSPFENQAASLLRRDLVLNKMTEQGFITPTQAAAAKQEKMPFAPSRAFVTKRFRAPYFTTYVIEQLKRKHHLDDEQIRRGGLRVYTTVNLTLQAAADVALRKGLAQIEARKASTGAVVSLDPWTGHVLALMGGLDFYDPDKTKKSQFNCATQSRRQPGSSFKPYIYAMAMEKGFTPDSRISDSRLSFRGWTVHNYDGRYRGRLKLRRALALSANVVAVRLLQQVGVEDTIRLAHALGIQSELDPYLPLALGASGVTLLEHTSGYGCFATGGLRAEPVVIERIENSAGEVVYEHKHADGHAEQLVRVISPRSAEYMQSMLVSVVEEGTGRRAKIPDVTCAGKTGTTSNHWDAWYMGFTMNPEVVTGVWVGNNELVEMYKASGGHFCAPIWKELTAQAVKVIHEERKRSQFKNPVTGQVITEEFPEEDEPQMARVRICNDSGLRARKYCSSTHRETFREEDVPRYCNLHTAPETTPSEQDEEVIVTVCGETGKIANAGCPTRLEKVFRASAAPHQVCRSHQESTTPDPPAPKPPEPPTGQQNNGNDNSQ